MLTDELGPGDTVSNKENSHPSPLMAYILVGDGGGRQTIICKEERISGQDKSYENHSLLSVSMGHFLFGI